MSESSDRHGRFSWSELITPDLAAAKTFYAGLFGWEWEDRPVAGEQRTYTIASVGGQPAAGLMETPPRIAGTPAFWGGYVTVDDVDATAELARSLGGQVCLGPQDIPQVGRFCVIIDPQGALFNVIAWAPKSA